MKSLGKSSHTWRTLYFNMINDLFTRLILVDSLINHCIKSHYLHAAIYKCPFANNEQENQILMYMYVCIKSQNQCK